jgi:hypothetical protein
LILPPFLDRWWWKFYGHFMQDNAMAHTAKPSINALNEVFS